MLVVVRSVDGDAERTVDLNLNDDGFRQVLPVDAAAVFNPAIIVKNRNKTQNWI